MLRKISTNQPPDRSDQSDFLPEENPIGYIMRKYGEDYIKIYKPPIQHIKLIRSMRICRTPALGGKAYICKKCTASHYVYHSCGQRHCSICQSVKREQWMDKMSKELLAVPYVHLITTMPHQLNFLARKYPRILYNVIMRSTKETVFFFSKDHKYLGATPGLISILHTWGSDMKYHVHVHSLMTFGGLDQWGNWHYPKHKTRLCKHKDFRDKFRDIFLKELKREFAKQQIPINAQVLETIEELEKKTWSYFVTKPTLSTDNIEKYLARYINKIAVGNSRLKILKATDELRLVYNDYANQIENEAAPKKIRKMNPLAFINQYLLHLPPPYFHKTRRYGLHASATKKKYADKMDAKLKRNGQTIRTVLEIITQLLKVPTLRCQHCQHDKFDIEIIIPDQTYIHKYINVPNYRAP